MAKKYEEKDTKEFPAVDTTKNIYSSSGISPLMSEDLENKGKRAAKFVRIVSSDSGSEVIVDVNGNGEGIPYVPEKHDGLKEGDPIEI